MGDLYPNTKPSDVAGFSTPDGQEGPFFILILLYFLLFFRIFSFLFFFNLVLRGGRAAHPGRPCMVTPLTKPKLETSNKSWKTDMHFVTVLTAHNWQKWKRVFLTCPRHEVYRDEAVGLKSCKYTWKITIYVNMWNFGQFHENLIFFQ